MLSRDYAPNIPSQASVKHRGYLRFRYNKLVYYVTPQTVHQAFYAPVVGYYACLLDNQLLVISGQWLLLSVHILLISWFYGPDVVPA